MNKKVSEVLKGLLKTGITVGVIYWIIQKFGFEKIASTVQSANPWWLLGGTLLFVFTVLLGALQWRILLKNRGVEFPLGKTISVYFTGIFFNNFMLGMVAGDSYKVAHLHINEGKAKSGFAATFYDRIAGLLVISLFAVVGGAYLSLTSTADSSVGIQLTDASNVDMSVILATVSGFAAILIGTFSLFLSKRLQQFAVILAEKIPHETIRVRLIAVLHELFIDRHDQAERKTFLLVLFYSFWIQLFRVMVHVIAAISLGIFSLDTMHFFFIIIPIISFLTIVPLPFGIREAVQGTLFLTAGYDKEPAMVMGFLATLMGIAGSLFGGVMFILERKNERVNR